jgi:hypothetical protein
MMLRVPHVAWQWLPSVLIIHFTKLMKVDTLLTNSVCAGCDASRPFQDAHLIESQKFAPTR